MYFHLVSSNHLQYCRFNTKTLLTVVHITVIVHHIRILTNIRREAEIIICIIDIINQCPIQCYFDIVQSTPIVIEYQYLSWRVGQRVYIVTVRVTPTLHRSIIKNELTCTASSFNNTSSC